MLSSSMVVLAVVRLLTWLRLDWIDQQEQHYQQLEVKDRKRTRTGISWGASVIGCCWDMIWCMRYRKVAVTVFIKTMFVVEKRHGTIL